MDVFPTEYSSVAPRASLARAERWLAEDQLVAGGQTILTIDENALEDLIETYVEHDRAGTKELLNLLPTTPDHSLENGGGRSAEDSQTVSSSVPVGDHSAGTGTTGAVFGVPSCAGNSGAITAAGDTTAALSVAKSSPSTTNGSSSCVADKLNDAARILAYNVMNFSFFPDEGNAPWFICSMDGKRIGEDDEAFAITESMRSFEMQLQGRSEIWRDPDFLLGLTEDDLRERVFCRASDAGELPLLGLRLKCLHSWATALKEKGGLGEMLAEATRTSQEDAKPAVDLSCKTSEPLAVCRVARFVAVFCHNIPAFRDLRGEIEFAKRIQLTVSMLHADNLVKFVDLDDPARGITVFSDYRIPQLFLSAGVFQLAAAEETRNGGGATLPGGKNEKPDSGDRPGVKDSTVLAETIRKRQLLEVGCAEEVALRCGTLVGAEALRRRLEERFEQKVLTANVDYFLWKTTVVMDHRGELSFPFHRTRTFCY